MVHKAIKRGFKTLGKRIKGFRAARMTKQLKATRGTSKLSKTQAVNRAHLIKRAKKLLK